MSVHVSSGEWRANLRDGQGTLQLAGGGAYRGAFAADAPHGEGRYAQPSGYA